MKYWVERTTTERAEVEVSDKPPLRFEDVMRAVGEQKPDWVEVDFRVCVKRPDSDTKADTSR